MHAFRGSSRRGERALRAAGSPSGCKSLPLTRATLSMEDFAFLAAEMDSDCHVSSPKYRVIDEAGSPMTPGTPMTPNEAQKCLPGCVPPFHHKMCPNFCAAAPLAVKLSTDEVHRISDIGGRAAATYGEITPKGFRQIFDRRLRADDHFVDAGSGHGKLVLQAATEGGVAFSTGIELSTTRHDMAMAALKAASARDATLGRRCKLICDDCAGEAAAGILQTATVVFIANLCFGAELQRRLALRLEAAPHLRLIAVVKPFADVPRGFEFDSSEFAEATWTQGHSKGAWEEHPGQAVALYRRVSGVG